MKNPLRKRLIREFTGELGKYLVIFILLIATIGFVSGFLVADNSMITAYNESFEKYNIENGHFISITELTEEQKKEIQKQEVTVYELYYVDEETDHDSTLRIFKERDKVNLTCLMKGEMPKQKNEIAIDRMYADNNDLSVGDTIKAGGITLSVTGLVALSDYSTMFEDNNDTMFDAIKFGVALMTEEGFAQFGDLHLKYNYAWKYDKEPEDEIQEKDRSNDLAKEINQIAPLEAFVPRYLNQAIQFTGEDMGSDRAMVIILLYIIIVIMAFVFGVTTLNTIAKEAAVIGTLRASGYTRGELLRHYLAMPLVVTLIGALIGNILGYTIFKNVCADMYYGSYSLPTYETLWNAEAFVLTTVVPIVIMLVLNLFILTRKLMLSPLQFLRREVRRNSRKKAIRLNKKLRFFTRFRLRIIFQNMSNYVILIVGILFANLLLMFGLLLPALLHSYQDEIVEKMISDYQYILKAPLETEQEDAEKFALTSLNTLETTGRKEQISIYGIEKDSSYLDLDLPQGKVYLSEGYAEKYRLQDGDTVTLQEKYGDKTYEFQVAGTYDYPAALAVFMDLEDFRAMFEMDEDYFTGYFSNEELTDIDEQYIGGIVDKDDLTKLSRQLDVSMGQLMYLVDGFSVLIFIVLIYLLSKIIIEKNAQPISMAKILGYRNGEISRLYILATSMIVVIGVLVSLPVETLIIENLLYYYMMADMNGWITFLVPDVVYVEMVLLGLLTYAIVAVLEYHRIRRVPMSEALKNVE